MVRSLWICERWRSECWREWTDKWKKKTLMTWNFFFLSIYDFTIVIIRRNEFFMGQHKSQTPGVNFLPTSTFDSTTKLLSGNKNFSIIRAACVCMSEWFPGQTIFACFRSLFSAIPLQPRRRHKTLSSSSYWLREKERKKKVPDGFQFTMSIKHVYSSSPFHLLLFSFRIQNQPAPTRSEKCPRLGKSTAETNLYTGRGSFVGCLGFDHAMCTSPF